MNSKQRVSAILHRQPFDRIPHSFDITGVIQHRIAEHYDIEVSQVFDFLQDDFKVVGLGSPRGFAPREVGKDQYYDEMGVLWDRGLSTQEIGDWGGIVRAPLATADLTGFHYPDPRAPGRLDRWDAQALSQSERYVIVFQDGLFDTAWHVRGFEAFMMDMAEQPDFCHELLDQALAYLLGLVEQIPSYVDGIRFGEDWGSQRGMLISPAMWRTFLKPRLKVLYAAARQKGLDVLIHSCGHIAPIFPDLIELGVMAVNPIQPEVMDAVWLKRTYGRDLVLYGGLSAQHTLPLGTPEEVLREARWALDTLGQDGGYIFGPAGAIPTDAKVENVIALTEFVRNGYR